MDARTQYNESCQFKLLVVDSVGSVAGVLVLYKPRTSNGHKFCANTEDIVAHANTEDIVCTEVLPQLLACVLLLKKNLCTLELLLHEPEVDYELKSTICGET